MTSRPQISADMFWACATGSKPRCSCASGLTSGEAEMLKCIWALSQKTKIFTIEPGVDLASIHDWMLEV